MKRDADRVPCFPPTFINGKHTGCAWSWIFWWCRNGVAWVAAAAPRERSWREHRRHRVIDEIEAECAILRRAMWERGAL